MELKDKPVPIVEIFSSLQGEGPRLRPAIFIRSALCCFKCPGFNCELIDPNGETIIGCDTIRAVSPKFKNNWIYYRNYNELIDVINKFIVFNPRQSRILQDIISMVFQIPLIKMIKIMVSMNLKQVLMVLLKN